MTTAKFSFLNMLADSLSNDGFICNDPDSIKWEVRGPKIVAMLENCFDEGCDAVGVVECDHPFSILEKLQSIDRPIYATFQRVRNPKTNVNNGYNQFLERGFPLDKKNNVRVPVVNPSNTFITEITDDADRAAIVSLMNSDRGNPFVPDLTETSSYVFDYCNVIFWNPATIESSPEYLEFNPSNFRGYKCFMGKGDNGFIQRFDKNNVPVFVVTAHLKSGEGINEEAERVIALQTMLSALTEVSNSVVLMDSNSSRHYKEGIPYNLDNVIDDCGFTNVISDNSEDPDDGLECFKMRDARGNQPPKFGELMFDKIDACLVKKNMKAVMVLGEPHYPRKYKELLYNLRTNKLLRSRVSNWVLNWHNVYDDDGNFVASGLMELRSNRKNCELIHNKDKTIILKKMSADVSSRWGDNVNNNSFEGFADYLYYGRSDMVLYQENIKDLHAIDLSMYEVTDDLLKSIFGYLSPSERTPSDHPLVTLLVELIS